MLKPEPDVVVPEGNSAKGAKLFKSKCAQCHTLNKGMHAIGLNSFTGII